MTVYCTIPTSNMKSGEITTNMQKPGYFSSPPFRLESLIQELTSDN